MTALSVDMHFHQFRCQIPQGVFVLFPPKQSATTCHSVPSFLVKVVLCFRRSYTQAPHLPWVIFLKSHKQIHHYLRPHLSNISCYTVMLPWWRKGLVRSQFVHLLAHALGMAMSCTSSLSISASLGSWTEQSEEVTVVTSSTQQKTKQNPQQNKSRRNQKLQHMYFVQGFPSFSGKAASLLSIVAATSKTCIIFWNGINYQLWAVTEWFSACKVTPWLLSFLVSLHLTLSMPSVHTRDQQQ